MTLCGSKSQQHLLDTVAYLPALKILHFIILGELDWDDELANFKPIQGLKYVEKLKIGSDHCYVLESDRWPVRYRKIRP
jgi:hypothetical protein